MNQGLFSVNTVVILALAFIPSLVAWIRLGPRVDQLERDRDKVAAALISSEAKRDLEIKVMSNCLTRLTTLQEVSERRLERLEDK